MSDSTRQAIVDIGSNTIRLVMFGGPARAPAPLFNEKVVAGLGRGLAPGGNLPTDAVRTALAALARFSALLRLAKGTRVRVVATAAVREAADGPAFIEQVRALGLPAKLLSGEDEAVAAGFGVISASPGVDGLVADMGGGSLELVRVAGGEVFERVSLPFGAMRIAEIRAGGPGRLRKAVRKALARLDWTGQVVGKPLYLVGGAWRTLARVHMHLTDWPLPVLGNYGFSADDARDLKLQVRAMGTARLAAIRGVSAARAFQLDDAAAMLAALVGEVLPDRVVISAQGLREGLLYQALSPAQRALDPLIEGVRHTLAGQQQSPDHAERLLEWSDPAFAADPAEERRLRHAACLIAGTGWAANPEFRAIEGEDMALHGHWIGVDAADRAVMAMALHVGLGGDPAAPPALIRRLADSRRLDRASAWGHAIRLAQRLGAGSPAALAALPLADADDGALVLRVPRGAAALIDPRVERRLARLALALSREARIESLP